MLIVLLIWAVLTNHLIGGFLVPLIKIRKTLIVIPLWFVCCLTYSLKALGSYSTDLNKS